MKHHFIPLARYEVVLHIYRTSLWRGWLVTVHTHGSFIVLPYWDIRLLAPWPAIPLTLSWHWANQCLPYPNNTAHQTRIQEPTSINFKVIGLTQPGFELWRSRLEPPRGSDFPDLPEWEADVLLIRPRRLVLCAVGVKPTSACTRLNLYMDVVAIALVSSCTSRPFRSPL